jgi:hypothetical protein
MTPALRPVVLVGSAEYDVGLNRMGKAQIEAQFPVGTRLQITAQARRYLPFFEYWTIWGYFSPVAYHEVELRTAWEATEGLNLWGAGAYRAYAHHNTEIFLEPLKGRGWRAVVGAEWDMADNLRVSGTLNAEGPVGAFGLAGDASVDWQASPSIALSLHGVLLEQIEEFRVGAGVVRGGGLSARGRLRNSLWVSGGAELYQQTQSDRPGRADWTQRRAWLMVQFDIGRDPGLSQGVDR